MASARSYTLPFFDVELPFPVYDLCVALATVCLFIPAVTLLHLLVLAPLMRSTGRLCQYSAYDQILDATPTVGSFSAVWRRALCSGLGPRRPSEVETPFSTWLVKELTIAPNLVSLARLVSGPCIAGLIAYDAWSVATATLCVAGVSDWLDGYLAKKLKYTSTMGAFLDPLADKTLICSTAGALVHKGILPLWVAAAVIGRDVALVLGTYVHYTVVGTKQPMSFYQHLLQMQRGGRSYTVQPTLISKANTVVQLSLVAACMGHGWIQFPGEAEILLLAKFTLLTTLGSWGSYTWDYLSGKRVIS